MNVSLEDSAILFPWSFVRSKILKLLAVENYYYPSLKMSWQAYVDTNLLGTGKVQKAAIFGLDGSQWATSAGFTVRFELD